MSLIVHELRSPMPVLVVKPGKEPEGALAYAWFDYGIEHNVQWFCCGYESGEFWLIENQFIRAYDNPTIGRVVKAKEKSMTAKTFALEFDTDMKRRTDLAAAPYQVAAGLTIEGERRGVVMLFDTEKSATDASLLIGKVLFGLKHAFEKKQDPA